MNFINFELEPSIAKTFETFYELLAELDNNRTMAAMLYFSKWEAIKRIFECKILAFAELAKKDPNIKQELDSEMDSLPYLCNVYGEVNTVDSFVSLVADVRKTEEEEKAKEEEKSKK